MQILVDGLLSGLSLALLSVAFSLVYLPTRVFYLALGAIYSVVPFIALSSLQIGLSWNLVAPAALMSGVLLSIVCETFNHQQLASRGAAAGAHLISSLGIYIVLTQIAAIIWGNDTRVLHSGREQIYNLVPNVILTQTQSISFVASAALLILYWVWMKRTNIGLLFRAMADNADQLILTGHNLRSMRLLAFGLAGFFASASSLLTSYDIGFDAHGGLDAILLAIVAVIIGGRQSFAGPVLGAVCLELIRCQTAWWLSAQWAEAVTFAILAVTLLLHPQGLLGSRLRLEAA